MLADVSSISRNRHDPGLLREEPGERDLRRSGGFALGDGADEMDESHVRFARLGREARDDVAEVSGVELRVFVDLAVRNPAPSGLKGTKPMPSSASAGSSSDSGSR